MLEAAVADIEFARGRFTIAGTDRVGRHAWSSPQQLRDGAASCPRTLPHSLDVHACRRHAAVGLSRMAATSPRSRSIPTPASIEVVSYAMVNDFGIVVNPMLVEGQAHGGVVAGHRPGADGAHGLRRAKASSSPAPTWTTRCRAPTDVPMFAIESHPVPATTNPLGVKGCGEAGCAGSLPAVMNAVVDALSELRHRHIDMPATPERIWRAIRDARGV